jgi:uncharacterized protein YecT (DUF1311 family)
MVTTVYRRGSFISACIRGVTPFLEQSGSSARVETPPPHLTAAHSNVTPHIARAIVAVTALTALAASMLFSANAHAAGIDCKSGDLNQMQMTTCASNDFKKADTALNRVYTQLATALDTQGRDDLRQAQRAWVVFRDKECVSRTGGGPNQQGSIWPMVYAQCLATLTRERTRDLTAQTRCHGGDLSCSP